MQRPLWWTATHPFISTQVVLRSEQLVSLVGQLGDAILAHGATGRLAAPHLHGGSARPGRYAT